MDDTTQDNLTLPADFRLLPAPMLPDVVGVSSDMRFFSLSYEGSKPFWSDGRAGATFSYYAAYEPFVDHLAVAINLFDVSSFLRRQHSPRRPPTPEEIEDANKRLDELDKLSLDQLREMGMFEFVFGPKPEQQDRCAEMVAWLDQYITEELIRSYVTYVAAAEAGRFEAFHYLNRLKQRIEYSRQINTSSRMMGFV